MYQIDRDKFVDYIKKATLSLSITQFRATVGRIQVSSRLMTPSSELISIVRAPNAFITTDDDILPFNINIDDSPALIKMLSYFDSNNIHMKIEQENKMIFTEGRAKMELCFCQPEMIPIVGEIHELEYFYSTSIKEFVEITSFNKMKKFSGSKIFIVVRNSNLVLLVSNKNRKIANLQMEVSEVDKEDFSLQFTFRLFNNLMSLAEANEDYTINLAYVDDYKLGAIMVSGVDERFYLMSQLEN